MNVFDIVNTITLQNGKSLASSIFANIENFFASPTFNEITRGEPVTMDSIYGKTVSFICAYYKCDVEGVLAFLRSEHMKEEYTFVLSYFCYIGIFNGWLQPSPELKKKHVDAIATCLCFPMIQQIFIGLSNGDHGRVADAQIAGIHADIIKAMWDLPTTEFLSLFNVPDDKKQTDPKADLEQLGRNLDLLLKGELFQTFERSIDDHLNKFLAKIKDEKILKGIRKLKNLFFFKPEFYTNEENKQQKSEVEKLIASAYSTQDTWEKAKTSLLVSPADLNIDKNEKGRGLFVQIKEKIVGKCDFKFMNVDEDAKKKLESYILPTMVFVFIYLKKIRHLLDPNNNNTRLLVIRHSLQFIWKLFENMAKEEHRKSNYVDPVQNLRLFTKEAKIEFLNKYTGLLYYLKMHKSDIYILRDLLTFVRNYVFNKTGKKPDEVLVESLVNDLKLDSFMELYDYLEELESGREISENYKENIVNLFVQIVSQYEQFKKHISDIKHIVKLIQGDFTQIDYFVEKLFNRTENANYTRSNLYNYIGSWRRVNQSLQGSTAGFTKEDSIMSIPKEDRETLFKRANDGMATADDIFLIIRGKNIKNTYIGFAEVELIFKRLGINFTEHRFCELLSASKLVHSKKAVGFTQLDFSYIQESEFSSILQYLEESVGGITNQKLKIAPRNLMNFSLVVLMIFVAIVVLSSNLMLFFFGGDFLGALFCALIPAAAMLLLSRVKAMSNIDENAHKEEFLKAFEVITNSKAELMA